MKKVMAIVLLAGVTAGTLPADAELTVTMEITSEMPLLPREDIIGKIRLTNNGTEAVKLVKNKEDYWFVFTQVRFFLDFSLEEQRQFISPPFGIPYGNRSRAFVKKETDFIIDKQGDFIVLSTGQSCEFSFDEVEFPTLAFIHVNRRFPFKAELYVQPDRWIPITITPPLEIAKDATFKWVTPHSVSQVQVKPVYVTRASIGTNEFLCASKDNNFFRFFDLSPDDQVEQNNSVHITITHKDGTKTKIDMDKIDILAKQREEKRKAKLTTGN